jgi:hypothetical protein
LSNIAGVVIPGIIPVGRITEDVSKLTAEDTEKIALVRSLADSSFDFAALNALFERQ